MLHRSGFEDIRKAVIEESFNGHPPLGVNATGVYRLVAQRNTTSFNGHPPLGVNATEEKSVFPLPVLLIEFQWAPTLGGECYQAE